jgi:small subunit ribosomal protein S20
MPIIQSAIKRARQNIVRRERRVPYKSQMKTYVRQFMDLMKEGKASEAQTLLPKVQKSIDMAVKKHILHKNTASRKKSRLALMLGKK